MDAPYVSIRRFIRETLGACVACGAEPGCNIDCNRCVLDGRKLLDVPHVQQAYEFDCGASALQAVLNYYGIEVREELVIDAAGTDPTGTPRGGIASAAEAYGLTVDSRVMSVWDLKEYIDSEIPVILCLQAYPDEPDVDWSRMWHNGHYVVMVGYDDGDALFQDPSSLNLTFLSVEELIDRWHDEDSRTGERHRFHGIAAFGKAPKHCSGTVRHMD